MTRYTLLAVFAVAFAATVFAAAPSPEEEPFQITADVIAADKTSGAMVASGHVHAVRKPYTLLSELLKKDEEGTITFAPHTHVTTCTNDADHLHWGVEGEIIYRPYKSFVMKNAIVRFFGVPVLWIPYLFMPSSEDCGYAMSPGWTSRWGAFMLNRLSYNIAGDQTHAEGSFYLDGQTRFDLRWEQGIAFGENLDWQLGNFGKGRFQIYYGYDRSDRYDQVSGDGWNYEHWGSTVPKNRYAIYLEHRWDVTERDILRVNGALRSDTYIGEDYLRDRSKLFSFGDPWGAFTDNEVAWEHLENAWYLGVSVGGPINDFDMGTRRLPEIYFDIAPTPLFSLPINYETENRVGYLQRHAALYGDSANISAYSYAPGIWADYESFRFDTYHRLTAPMKFWDALSVVPRLGYHGTIYSEGGYADITGTTEAGTIGSTPFRNIVEGGVTFAGRGTAWLNDSWQHMIEPYFDVLAQQAFWSGLRDGERAYVYDSIDMSRDWSDQFAGRGRNLPYSWYGVTPGVRNAFRKADEFGNLQTVFDFDVYCALQFNSASYLGDNDLHKLAENGKPNYGERGFTAMPGFRMRWFPTRGASLSAQFEYDSDHNAIALGDIAWRQTISPKFKYYAMLAHRNFRWWDFSSPPYDENAMTDDELGVAHLTMVDIGFEHEICDAIAWGPFRDNVIDRVGGWIDYRLDCLGFRFFMAYENEYELLDSTKYDREFNIGFMIYLRAFGPSSGLGIGEN